MKNNIVLYFYAVSKKKSDYWLRLVDELMNVFDGVICVFSPNVEDDIYNLFCGKAVVLKEPKNRFLLVGKTKSKYYDSKWLEGLSRHPELSIEFRLLRIIPYAFIRPILKEIIANKISFLDKVLMDHKASHVMIMEPKNFLYSLSVIILEALCKKHKAQFNFIHGSFVVNNIRMFDNLNRHDKELFVKYRKVRLTKQEYYEANKFMNRYKSFLFKDLAEHLTKIKSGFKKKYFKDGCNKPYVLFLDSKPGNYRGYYVNPEWRQTDILKAIKLFPEQYDFVYKSHPKGKNKYFINSLKKHNIKIVDNSFDSYSLIKGADVVVTNVSHSFVDAMLLNKKVVIIGGYNYLFSYESGPFVRVPNLEFFGVHFNEIMNKKTDSNGVRKLFYLINESICDDYFDLDRTIDRFKASGVFFDDEKAVEMIVDFYSDQLLIDKK